MWRRKLKRKKAYIKLQRKRFSNETLKNILLSIQDEGALLYELRNYWQNFWNKIERKRFSPGSKEAFRTIKSICKYHEYEKRDASIVSRVLLDDGTIITDQNQISAKLLDVLSKIQLFPQYEQYNGQIPFPELPSLEADETEGILKSLAHGKAVSYDLLSDSILCNQQLTRHLAELLQDLWSKELNK